MSSTSFNQILRGEGADKSRGLDLLGSHPHAALIAAEDELRGRFDKVRSGQGDGETKMSAKLNKRLGAAGRFGFRPSAQTGAGAGDLRQRAIVKVHFFGHGGGGASAMKAHVRYVARDGADRDPEQDQRGQQQPERSGEEEAHARAHAAYLDRGPGSGARFYDGLGDDVDGAARAAVWTREDKRHFRIILAAENGQAIKDLRAYTRTVMDEAEQALGTRLEWFAIDHFDTDNPHSHIVLRGRRGDGRPLVLPRPFVQQGLRDIARETATDRLGQRTRDDDARALEKEARAHRPTRLDALIERQLTAKQTLRIAALRAPDQDPHLTNALKTRARELQRLGLARETSRNVLHFTSGWREQLKAMELHLDIRKRMMHTRQAQTPQRTVSSLRPPWR